MEEFHLFTLANGIRIAHKQVPHTQISHLGLMLDIGSRDELPHQQGLAHFWEHLAFKGTQKRSSLQIINRLETVGGELNAYTTKEKVCFHASVLTQHFERAAELLTDITFHSIFPEKQLDKERNVILEEMAMYYDAPDDAIQDDFEELLFPDHQLGRNILGNQSSVTGFQQADLLEFIAENMSTDRIVFSSIGHWPFQKVRRVLEKYLADIPTKISHKVREQPLRYQPQVLTSPRGISQTHVAMGRPSYGLLDARRLPFFMLVNLLGGPGMNSRLNLSIRERNGLVYSIDAHYNPYIDSGFWGLYFATEPRHVKRSMELIRKELRKLCEVPLTGTQLQHTQNQLMGQLAMSEESNMSFMLMMAKSLLDLERVDTMEDLFRQISHITASQLRDLANEMFQPDDLSQLTFVPSN
jgi:predicted Zn-dependent peptidase